MVLKVVVVLIMLYKNIILLCDHDYLGNALRLILSKGADVNSISGQGYTPLHMVTIFTKTEVITLRELPSCFSGAE